MFEAVIQGALGGAIGLVLGALLAVARACFEYGALASAAFSVAGEVCGSMLLALGSGIVLSALAAVGPAFLAARLAPMEAMRVD